MLRELYSRCPPPHSRPLPRPRSQWGRVEDEATESMTPHKPAALSTQSGLLSPQQRGARTPLLLVVALCIVQTLLLAVLGGGLTGARWTLERLDAALEGARRSRGNRACALRVAPEHNLPPATRRCG